MGTSQKGPLQSENSWSGWAVSSFTNKLAAATGEMQAKTSSPQPRAQSTDGRSSISSLPGNTSRSAHIKPSPLPDVMRRTVNAITTDLPSTSTDQLFIDEQDEDEGIDDAWGDMAEESFFDAPSESKSEPAIAVATAPTPTPIAAFDDGGEPDFEGWLKAQMQSKTKLKQALPKGLVKSATLNKPPAPVRISSTGSSGLGTGAKKLPITTPKATSSTSIGTKPKDGAADDDWGDAWD